jgi:hypothetical protein
MASIAFAILFGFTAVAAISAILSAWQIYKADIASLRTQLSAPPAYLLLTCRIVCPVFGNQENRRSGNDGAARRRIYEVLEVSSASSLQTALAA